MFKIISEGKHPFDTEILDDNDNPVHFTFLGMKLRPESNEIIIGIPFSLEFHLAVNEILILCAECHDPITEENKYWIIRGKEEIGPFCSIECLENWKNKHEK